MQEVILGIFSSNFWKMAKINMWSDWPFNVTGKYSMIIPDDFVDFMSNITIEWNNNQGFCENIYKACAAADVINMLLDGIILPLDTKSSVTCCELTMILHYPLLLDKTKFWLDEILLDKDKVLDIIQKVQNEKITFNNIKF